MNSPGFDIVLWSGSLFLRAAILVILTGVMTALLIKKGKVNYAYRLIQICIFSLLILLPALPGNYGYPLKAPSRPETITPSLQDGKAERVNAKIPDEYPEKRTKAFHPKPEVSYPRKTLQQQRAPQQSLSNISSPPPQETHAFWSIAPTLLSGWLTIAFLLLFIRITRNALTFYRAINAKRLQSPKWLDLVTSLQKELGYKISPVHLFRCPPQFSPHAFGDSFVGLPPESECWEEDICADVLRHELIHIGNRDWRTKIFGQISQDLYWPLQLVGLGYLVNRTICKLQEWRADYQVVVTAKRHRTQYANSLISIAEYGLLKQFDGCNLFGSTRRDFDCRIDRILNREFRFEGTPSSPIQIALVASLLAGAAVSIVEGENANKSPDKGNQLNERSAEHGDDSQPPPEPKSQSSAISRTDLNSSRRDYQLEVEYQNTFTEGDLVRNTNGQGGDRPRPAAHFESIEPTTNHEIEHQRYFTNPISIEEDSKRNEPEQGTRAIELPFMTKAETMSIKGLTKLLERINTGTGGASIYHIRGLAYRNSDRVEESILDLSLAAEIYDSILSSNFEQNELEDRMVGWTKDWSMALQDLGDTLVAAGDPEGAIQSLKNAHRIKSWRVKQGLEDSREPFRSGIHIAIAYNNIGNSLYHHDLPIKARSHLLMALDLLENLSSAADGSDTLFDLRAIVRANLTSIEPAASEK